MEQLITASDEETHRLYSQPDSHLLGSTYIVQQPASEGMRYSNSDNLSLVMSRMYYPQTVSSHPSYMLAPAHVQAQAQAQQAMAMQM